MESRSSVRAEEAAESGATRPSPCATRHAGYACIMIIIPAARLRLGWVLRVLRCTVDAGIVVCPRAAFGHECHARQGWRNRVSSGYLM